MFSSLMAGQPDLFQAWKQWMEAETGLDRDSLHVCVGLAVFVLTMLLLRRGPHRWLPLLAVFAAALTGEILDVWALLTHWEYRWSAIRWSYNWHDLVFTSIIPAVIFLMARAWYLMTTDDFDHA
ncbi:hypothetical protein [Alterisphingorhabdus coralli]|uniref:Transmembrane protein n=1 Tax=Alterisphingorhabdus coralli TaxID=3071408 RepID=A0AA97F826_9SPHN|nr:hypothetical protein [Parasphingorhabdus sp. SCSIO 66989]WOE76059.1 hypothetical protein RB602_04895 [Parasphingorhabdus sp. SCSIO 66989]